MDLAVLEAEYQQQGASKQPVVVDWQPTTSAADAFFAETVIAPHSIGAAPFVAEQAVQQRPTLNVFGEQVPDAPSSPTVQVFSQTCPKEERFTLPESLEGNKFVEWEPH